MDKGVCVCVCVYVEPVADETNEWEARQTFLPASRVSSSTNRLAIPFSSSLPIVTSFFELFLKPKWHLQ